MRVTDKQIHATVARLNRQGMDIGLDGQYGRFRVTNREGSRDLSPRVSNRQVLDWLLAFEQGWQACDRLQESVKQEVSRGMEDDREGGDRAGVHQAASEGDAPNS